MQDCNHIGWKVKQKQRKAVSIKPHSRRTNGLAMRKYFFFHLPRITVDFLIRLSRVIPIKLINK